MKHAVVINGSPKLSEKGSFSSFLAQQLSESLRTEKLQVFSYNARAAQKADDLETVFKTMADAEAIVFIVPLYFFCLPGNLMRFLTAFETYLKEVPLKGVKVYAMVQCGFPEPEICLEAVQVIRYFAKSIGATFRFGTMIGSGGMVPATIDAPFMRKTRTLLMGTLKRIAEDIDLKDNAPIENVPIRVQFPRRLYFMMGNTQWSSMARKSGLKKRDLYRRPYIY
jgi:hypothetical protein